MIKKRVKMLLMLLCLAMGTSTPCMVKAENTEQEEKVYYITPEDAGWSELGSVSNKIEACRIDNEILDQMTDGELVQAVLDFPFIIDLFLYDDYDVAIDELYKNSDAFRELLSRESAKDVVMDRIETQKKTRAYSTSTKTELDNDALMIMMLYTDGLKDKVTDDDIEVLDGFSNIFTINPEKINPGARMAYLYTPNGTSVACRTPSCSHDNSSYHSELDTQVVATYGVTLVSAGTCRYNCHSYAWYTTSSNNGIWIDNPSAYMTDGSYSMLMSGLYTISSNAGNGAKVCYGSYLSPLHSAILTSGASNITLRNRIATSKWGSAGVFTHAVDNVPALYWDSAYSISVWN